MVSSDRQFFVFVDNEASRSFICQLNDKCVSIKVNRPLARWIVHHIDFMYRRLSLLICLPFVDISSMANVCRVCVTSSHSSSETVRMQRHIFRSSLAYKRPITRQHTKPLSQLSGTRGTINLELRRSRRLNWILLFREKRVPVADNTRNYILYHYLFCSKHFWKKHRRFVLFVNEITESACVIFPDLQVCIQHARNNSLLYGLYCLCRVYTHKYSC